MIFNDALQQAKHAYSHPRPGTGCPGDDILSAFVYQELSGDAVLALGEHVKQCEACRVKRLNMEMSREASDLLLEQGFQSALDTVRQAALLSPEAQALPLIAAQYFWDVEESGRALTGQTATVTREHDFATQEGLLRISCAWGDAFDNEPAFLWLSWKPKFDSEQAFSLQLVDLESHKVIFTLSSEITASEEQHTFKEEGLGFNPVRVRWGIQVTMLGKA